MSILRPLIFSASFIAASSPVFADEHQDAELYESCARVFTELRDIRSLFDFVGSRITSEATAEAFERIQRQFEPDVQRLQDLRDNFCTQFIA